MLNNIIKRSLTTSAQQSSRTLNLGMIPGDGIGKEVIPAAQRVLEALPSQYNLKFNFIPLQAGFELFQKEGVSLPQETVDTLKNECNGAMFGAVSSPSHKVAGYSSPIVALRKKLDLYANVRPVASSKGVGANQANPIDLLIIRENTECLYIKEEELTTDENGNQVAYAKRKISKYASERAGHISFKMALMRHKLRQAQDPNNNRPPKVTITHKSNVLSVTDGLWRETINQVYKDHPEYHSVQVEEQLVDSMVYRLFREPHMFDVIVAPNLYGDLLSDGAAALVGSLGLVPSANVGDNFAMGEPVHGSAPDIVGQNKANPIASIRSAALLLEQMGHFDAASSIYSAVDNTLLNGVATPDLGGKSTTTEVTESVISHLK